MNGPQHYQEAEDLLTRANNKTDVPLAEADWLVATAQVHATLALAAATAAPVIKRWLGSESALDEKEWAEVAG